MLQSIVFITGAAILALELLASRILTLYFGVSLYIWSGILSITLISLALGYWIGGRLAGGGRGGARTEHLAYQFALMPAIAAIATVVACLVYPYLFHHLARFDLVFGAFIACLVLLFVPLLATAAMNPLLVAILLRLSAARGELADAGAGRVFFVSTLGSVVGVLVTAFGMIPYLSNFAAALVVAMILAALPLILVFGTPIKIARRKPLLVKAAVALMASAGLLAGADAYIGRMWPASYAGATWSLEASYRSMFGTVKILKSEPRENGRFQRIYFQDGLVQNTVDSDQQSTSMYTYALEALAFAYRAELRSALVLGIGAGMVPMRLAGLGVKVTAVDIDPASLRAATEVFGYDTAKVNTQLADARTFLRSCDGGYDVVIVDLFHGDGVPDYLVTRDFFRDLRNCLGAGGIAVFNTFADLDAPRSYAHFLATLRSELPFITLYRPDSGNHINSYVIAAGTPLPAPAGVDLRHVPQRHLNALSAMLRDPQSLDRHMLEHGLVITDAHSTVSKDIAASQLINRLHTVNALPAAFLVN